MKKFLLPQLLLMLLLGLNYVTAQERNVVMGVLCDTILKPIQGANIILIDNNDTLKTVSLDSGKFKFNYVKSSQFTIQVNALGFKWFRGSFNKDLDHKLTYLVLTLHISSIQLKEVAIKNKLKPVIFKKDTIEYNASYYNLKGDLETLLKQLPGVEVDEGDNVTVNGFPVSKLRVNGTDFFTSNVKDYIKQLPAGIFDKVQVINDYGSDGTFLGIKKGQPNKILNLVTKPGMDHGQFGSIKLAAGSNNLYGATFNENFWKSAKQISVAANLNTQKNVIGANNTSNISLTYNNNLSKKINVINSYNFSILKTSSENSSFAESINSLGIINNNTVNTTETHSFNHHFSSNLTFKPNDFEYLKSTVDLSLNQNNNTLDALSQQSGIIRENLNTESSLVEKNLQTNLSISFGQRLDKKGRLIIAAIEYNNYPLNNQQRINNNIIYYDTTGKPSRDSTLNRLIINNNHMQTGSLNINYLEPITTSSKMNLTYNIRSTLQKTDLITNLIIEPFDLIKIDSLSQSFNSILLTQSLGVNYQYNHNKITFLSGINLEKNTLSETYKNRPKITNAENNFYPSINFQYVPSEYNSYEINYSGASTAPTFDQLQPVKDTRDLQNIIIGNPNLKPSFSHMLNFTYRHMGPKFGLLFLNASANFVQNQIISNVGLIKDTLGNLKQVTSYLNVNGTYILNSAYNWSLPFKLYKQLFRLSFIGSVSYNYGIVYADSLRSNNTNSVYSQRIKVTGYLKKLSFDGSVQYLKNANQYTTGNGLNSDLEVWDFSFHSNIMIYENLDFSIESSKRLNKGYNNINVNNPFIVNATLELMLLKKNNINIQLQALDIFNQSNSINQTISGNTVTNSQSNYVSRYFILSFNMPIKKFGKSDK